MRKNLFSKQKNFINRELSWLEFNDRVLQEARDKKNPLFERFKFLSIVSSNLDEFFMIRVASIKDQVHANYTKADPSGLNPKQQLNHISERAAKMVREQYSLFNRSLVLAAGKAGIRLVTRHQVTPTQQIYLESYFTNVVYPVLTPMAVDSSRPFPLILNKSLNIGTLVRGKKNKSIIFATVQVPSVLPRFIEMPGQEASASRNFILMEEIIMMFIDRIFSGHHVECAHPYRITRNADLSLAEDEADDLLMEIEKSLKKRKWGAAVRLEVGKKMDARLVRKLRDALEISEKDIYFIPGPIDLTFLMKIYSMEAFEDFRYPAHTPRIPAEFQKDDHVLNILRERDILLHHPYDSFEPVINMIRTAADDPQVLAIKQTLYRVSGDSPIVEALAEAAEKGKQVTVLLEIKARFDEENNIHWARRLEHAGCHVIYGLVGLKTHCKITLVVRVEEDGIKRYVHLGTGNYNDITAMYYTDIGLMTCDEHFGSDASAVFNMLSGYSELPELYKLDVAPKSLRQKVLNLIRREREHALNGTPARIIAKMNSLVDKHIIEELYQASKAGVQVDLIIRGICCLRPGLPEISEHITVRSIVGRYLEHSRIFYFYNGSQEEIYLSSADWMPRNLDRRIELMFPVDSENIKHRIKEILDILLKDTAKTRILSADGKYNNIDRRGRAYFNAQAYFFEELPHKKAESGLTAKNHSPQHLTFMANLLASPLTAAAKAPEASEKEVKGSNGEE